MFVKLFNLILKDGNKINPLIGNAGVSARAVTPGTYQVPQPMVESMYVPQWRATGAAEDLLMRYLARIPWLIKHYLY